MAQITSLDGAPLDVREELRQFLTGKDNPMALQDKKIMPPPWMAFPEIERYSIGWRMGYGEDYIYRFGDWLDTLSPEERTEYRALFPEPVTWKGWWDDEDSSEMLEHGRASPSTPGSGSSRSLPPGERGSCACSGAISLPKMAS